MKLSSTTKLILVGVGGLVLGYGAGKSAGRRQCYAVKGLVIGKHTKGPRK